MVVVVVVVVVVVKRGSTRVQVEPARPVLQTQGQSKAPFSFTVQLPNGDVHSVVQKRLVESKVRKKFNPVHSKIHEYNVKFYSQ